MSFASTRLGLLPIVVLVSACSGDHVSWLPRSSERGAARAALLVWDRAGARVVVAMDLRASDEGRAAYGQVDAEDGDPIVAVLFAEDLDALGLDEGPVAVPGVGESGRLFPEARLAAHVATVDRAGMSWSPIDPLPDWVAATPIPPFDGRRCLGLSRCITSRGEDLWCDEDCRAQEIAPPAPAAPPASPSLWPCPAGWTAEARPDGAEDCVSPAERGSVSCALGESMFADREGCVPIGPACPTARWPSGPGVRVRPVPGAIAAASSTAGPAATLLLAAETYTGDVTLAPGQTLRGVCAARTTVAPSNPIVIWGTNALSALRLSGPLTLVNGARLELKDGLLDGVGLFIQNDTTLDAERVLISSPNGHGVEVADGARATLKHVTIADAALGVVAHGPSASADLGDVLVHGAREDGLSAVDGGRLVVRSSVVVNAVGSGLVANGLGSSLALFAVVVRGAGSSGLSVGAGADVQADGLRLTDIGGSANGVQGDHSEAALRDVILERIGKVGFESGSGMQLWVERGSVVGSLDEAFGVIGSLSGSDLTAIDTGAGLFVKDGTLIVERVRVLRALSVGVWAVGTSRVTLVDLTVDGVHTIDEGVGYANSVNVADSSSIEIERAHIAGVGNCGGLASQRGTIAAKDVTVFGCLNGLIAERAGSIIVDRLSLEGPNQNGALANDSGTIEVRDGALNVNGGFGVEARGLGTATFERFVVRRAGVGIRLGPLGTLDLTDGTIEDAELGVSLEASYDVSLFPMLDRVRVSRSARPVAP